MLIGLAIELAKKTSYNLAVLMDVIFAKVTEVRKVLEKIRRLAVRLKVNVKAPLAFKLRVSEALKGFAF